jgi:hypothetical protein
MNLLQFSAVAALAVLSLAYAVPAAAQGRASADIVEMEEKERALVAKESLKQRRDARQGGKKGSSDSDCGSVDIGNDNSSQRGSNRIAERQKTVIVTGNVINTAKCK